MAKKEDKRDKPIPPRPCHEVDVDTLVKVEFDTINNRPFLGQISDDELLYLWVAVFNRNKDELYGISSTKTLTRKVRATFKLKAPVKLADLFECGTFAYEKFLDDGTQEEITGRILGYGASKPCEVGDLAKVTIRTNWVQPSGVLKWLRIFGTVSGKCDYQTNETTGLKTDVFEAEVLLKEHINEYLPMYGQKAQVFYPGMPRVCNRCYTSGHLRRDCQNKKKDWVCYIIELLDGGLDPDLVGSWSKAVSRWRAANMDKDK